MARFERERASETSGKKKPEVGVLPTRYSRLTREPDVREIVFEKKQQGEAVSKNPVDQIALYLAAIDKKHGLMGGPSEIQEAEVKKHVMDPSELPEGYLRWQQRIAREEGHGEIELTPRVRQEIGETVMEDQKRSLETWLNYLNDPKTPYPTWFRYYAIREVLQLGSYDKETQSFKKRKKNTTTPFIELNREVLAKVYESLEVIQERKSPEPTLDEIDFATLYAAEMKKAIPMESEHRQHIAGEWIRYKQIHKDKDVKRVTEVVSLLEGKGTGWCIAGQKTAEQYLKRGDFYVYATYDAKKQPTIPRAIIRMEGGKVAEVRGILPQQALESEIVEVAEKKMASFPGADLYKQRVSDMKQVTAIETKQKNREELSLDDLRFIYEVDRDIEGFGYLSDPRIEEIQNKRDKRTDGLAIFGCNSNELAISTEELTDETKILFGDLKATELPDDCLPAGLEHIQGNAFFNQSRVKDMGKVKTIAKGAYYNYADMEDLRDLTYIGGDVIFSCSLVRSTGKLTTVRGAASFSNSHIEDYSSLTSIGKESDLYAPVRHVRKLWQLADGDIKRFWRSVQLLP